MLGANTVSFDIVNSWICPWIYVSLCVFIIGSQISQVWSLPCALRHLSNWGRWYDLLSPGKGQNATVPPLQVTKREIKDSSTRFFVIFRRSQLKKVNKLINTLLHCFKWRVNQMRDFLLKEGEERKLITIRKAAKCGNCWRYLIQIQGSELLL